MLLSSDLQPMLDIRSTFNTRPTLNVILSALCFQAEVLYIHKPKNLDYLLTNFFSI